MGTLLKERGTQYAFIKFQGVERSKGSGGRLTPQCSPPQRSFTRVCLFTTAYTIGQLKQLILVRVIALLLFYLCVLVPRSIHNCKIRLSVSLRSQTRSVPEVVANELHLHSNTNLMY
ncbi:hypothetical protein J4Q44_G00394400 [Coregonus suidteri]|uniref:Uncharacterized protein n=1 Tax=Coregonus suidteri TaxID=861788 RepID=A0AAN8Q3V0_9TELE